MAKNYFIKQFIYTSLPDPDENIFDSLGTDVFITKIGIQGYPGLNIKFQKDTEDTGIIIGNTGIFELDLESTGNIFTSMYFADDQPTILPYTVIVDILGFKLSQD